MSDYSKYAGTWTIDPVHSRLGFVARHAMVTKVRGSFDKFAGTIVIDAATPENSTAAVDVELASINTNNADRDAHLRSADFFDVDNNAAMTFKSTKVKVKGDDVELTGDLTIKGVTKEIEIELEADGVSTDPFGNVRAGFEGEAELSRKDYGLTWNVALETGGVLVSDKIKIVLDVSLIKQVEAAAAPEAADAPTA